MKKNLCLPASLFFFFILFSKVAMAANCKFTFAPENPKFKDNVSVDIGGLNSNTMYTIVHYRGGSSKGGQGSCITSDSTGHAYWPNGIKNIGYRNRLEVWRGELIGAAVRQCIKHRGAKEPICSRELNIEPIDCNLSISPEKPTDEDDITIKVGAALPNDYNKPLIWELSQNGVSERHDCTPYIGTADIYNISFGKLSNGPHNFMIGYAQAGIADVTCANAHEPLCEATITVGGSNAGLEETSPAEEPYTPLNVQGSCDKNEVDTALGCIPTGDFNKFVVWVLKLAMAISGGIAFLMMIFGGFRILVSAGNPKGVQAGGEMVSSALMGLLFIIFSIFLLQLIGVKILELPGL